MAGLAVIPTLPVSARELVCSDTKLVGSQTKDQTTVETERLICVEAHHAGDGFCLRAHKSTVETAVRD